MLEPTTLAELTALRLHDELERTRKDYPSTSQHYWSDLNPEDRGRLISVSAGILEWMGLLGLHVQLEDGRVVVHAEKRIVRATQPEPAEQDKIKTPAPKSDKAQAYASARARGYTGNTCSECQGMRMVLNGRCEKCEDCGATTGCS